MTTPSAPTDLKARVLVALKYTDKFAFPLNTYEVWQRLPGGQGYSLQEAAQALVALYSLNLVEYQDWLWSLAGSAKVNKSQRTQRQKYTQDKISQLSGLLQFFRWLPWIRGVAITGSAAMSNASKNDDVDFLLITAPQRLWLVRPLATAYAWLKGKRRSWQKEEENSWCFNLWLDTNNLAMPKAKRNFYTAYEVCQVRWLLSKDKLTKDFFVKNRWAGVFVPNCIFGANQRRAEQEVITANLPSWIVGAVLDLLNYGAYLLQLWYMESHRTTEEVGLGYAFFHPRDTYRQIKQYLQG